MTRRLAAVLAAAVLAGLAGCSSDDAAPATGSTTGTSPTASAMVVTTGSSSSPPTSAASPSSVGVPTPSVIDVPTQTPTSTPTENPWPADLTPEQVVDAQAAIAAYRAYWQMVDTAAAQPGQDWTQEVSEFTAGPAKDTLLQTFSKLADRGQYSSGITGTNPMVRAIESGVVELGDCVDKSKTDSFNAAGESVRAPDGPGAYLRHPSSVQMARLDDGRWVVVLTTDDWSQTC